LPPRRSQTPDEYAERLGALAPAQQGVFRRLSALYARERWGGGLATEASDEASQLYTQARPSLTSQIVRRLRMAPLNAWTALHKASHRSRRAAPLEE